MSFKSFKNYVNNLFIIAFFCFNTSIAHASALSGITQKIDAFNIELKLLGGSLSITGLIVAVLIYILGMGGMQKAVMAVVGGILIASAKEIMQSIMF